MINSKIYKHNLFGFSSYKLFLCLIKHNILNIRQFVILGIIWIAIFAGNSSKVSFKEPPPGTVFLSDSLYIDAQPIRVVDYLEFLTHIRHSYTPRLHDSIAKLPLYNLLPDIAYHLYDSLPMDSVFYNKMLTRTWKVLSSDKKIYDVDYHLTSSKYYNYPVVNVNFYQVFEYCRWRTDMVKINYAVRSKSLKQRRKYPINFIYRQVNRTEWEKAMAVYFDDVVKLSDKVNGVEKYNAPAAYIKTRKRKFYYDSENAAEYLKNEIVTTGFNWRDKYGIGDVRYVYYQKPVDWIGFRCICEVLPDTINKPVVVKVKLPKKQKTEKIKTAKPKKKKGIKVENLKR